MVTPQKQSLLSLLEGAVRLLPQLINIRPYEIHCWNSVYQGNMLT